MNTPVSFELAKLLKEKKFNEKTSQAYVYRGIEHQSSSYKGRLTQDKLLCDIPAPTIAEVVMWLYEKHGIWIYVERYSTLFRCYAEEIGDERFGKWEGHKYESPTEAYEAAIEYTLTKLI